VQPTGCMPFRPRKRRSSGRSFQTGFPNIFDWRRRRRSLLPGSSVTSPKNGRPCLTCGHRKCRQIEQALAARTLLREIGKRYGMSPASLIWHRDHHVRPPEVRRSTALALYEMRCTDGASPPPSGRSPLSADPVGGSRVGWDLHTPQWRSSPGPRPGGGSRCSGCRGSSWWVEIYGLFGGCRKCAPAVVGVITRNFET
jgi:hypothetical protein